MDEYLRLVRAAQELTEASFAFARATIDMDTANAPATVDRLRAAWAALEASLRVPA